MIYVKKKIYIYTYSPLKNIVLVFCEISNHICSDDYAIKYLMQKLNFPCAHQLNITIFAKNTLLKYKTMQSLWKLPYYKDSLQEKTLMLTDPV